MRNVYTGGYRWNAGELADDPIRFFALRSPILMFFRINKRLR